MTINRLTLWDLLKRSGRTGKSSAEADGKAGRADRNAGGAGILPAVRSDPTPEKPRRQPMQQRYDDLVTEMKLTYTIRIRKWRNSSSGCAWIVRYQDGSLSRLIESPYPRGPISCAIFLHEVAHHAIGFGTYKPRCLEEYHAWQWAVQTMRERGFNVTQSVENRMAASLRYAITKAQRRGLKRVPGELASFISNRTVP